MQNYFHTRLHTYIRTYKQLNTHYSKYLILIIINITTDRVGEHMQYLSSNPRREALAGRLFIALVARFVSVYNTYTYIHRHVHYIYIILYIQIYTSIRLLLHSIYMYIHTYYVHNVLNSSMHFPRVPFYTVYAY